MLKAMIALLYVFVSVFLKISFLYGHELSMNDKLRYYI